MKITDSILAAVINEEWAIRPDYGKENAYRVWEADTMNFHDDTSPEAMDARANLMMAAPALRAALILARGFIPKQHGAVRARVNAAIKLADEGRE